MSRQIPKYRRHKASGQAVVALDGRDFYLGRYATAASKKKYARLIAEWLANEGRMATPNPQALTVSELCNAFRKHATAYYRRPDSTPTSEPASFAAAPQASAGALRVRAGR